MHPEETAKTTERSLKRMGMKYCKILIIILYLLKTIISINIVI